MSNPNQPNDYQGRPSKKKMSFADLVLIAAVIGAVGYFGYLYGPFLWDKFKESIGMYDEVSVHGGSDDDSFL